MSRTIDLSESEYSLQPKSVSDADGQVLMDFGYEEPKFRQDPARHREDHNGSATTPTGLVARRTGPLKGVDPKKVASVWQLLEQLNPGLPLNEYGLPVYVYRPDMLDYAAVVRALTASEQSTVATTTSFPPAQHAVPGQHTATSASMAEVQQGLEAAIVPLTYNEGFPVTPGGMPFWMQLEFEPKEAYDAFVSYLELGGARQLSALIAYNLEELREYFHTYYWGFRVKAFDLYKVAHHQKVKLQRMLSTEDSHFKIAEKLLKKVEAYFEGKELDDEDLSADKVVGMLEKLVKIQRVSVGLPANGESKEADGDKRKVTPVQILMQQISQNGSENRSNTANEVDLLLEDPDAVDMAQELIIKMQNNSGG